MNIDWSQLITKAMNDQVAASQVLSAAISETARCRSIADSAIAPLQDAVDIDEATAAEVARLKVWKKYRVELNRLPDQPGYPSSIIWPVAPA